MVTGIDPPRRIVRIKADKNFALKVIAKNLKPPDQEVLEHSYDAGLSFFKTPPYLTFEKIQATLDFMGETEP